VTGCDHTAEAGAFVLEALPEAEAAAFAVHVERCAACRAEVARLQVVADTLPLAAPVVPPPPHLKGRIMAVVESEAALLRAAGAGADEVAPARPAEPRRRRSWRSGSFFSLRPVAASLAAALLVAIGVAGGLILGGDNGSSTTTRVVQAEVELPRALGARAELAITGHRGRLHTANFPLPPDGRVYQVWIERGADRAPEPTNALFTVDRRTGSGSVEVPDLRWVTKVLVTAEPRGGSKVPTAPPVLSVRLA
jgi:anti-sigma-K factor RskA